MPKLEPRGVQLLGSFAEAVKCPAALPFDAPGQAVGSQAIVG